MARQSAGLCSAAVMVLLAAVGQGVPVVAQALPGDSPAAFKAALLSRGRDADATGIYNSLIAAQVGTDARFNFGAFPAGGSNLSGSNSFNLSFAWPSAPGTSYSTVRVDGVDFTYGSGEGLVQAPTSSGNTCQAIYDYGDLRVVQELTIVNGPSSGVPDTIRIAYRLSNQGTVAHDVGLRIMMDTMLGGNDAAPFRLPNVGPVDTEQQFEGAAVPDYWQAFSSLTEAGVSSQGTFTGPGLTRPDRFVIANWGSLSGAVFDYLPSIGAATGDSAIAIYWNPRRLGPGEQVELATLYGVGSQSVASGALLLGLTAPAVVPRVAEAQFDVVAVVENPSTATVTGVALVLTAPDPLLPAAREVRQVPIGDLAPGATGQATWTLLVPPSTPLGTYELLVEATSTDPAVTTTSVRRDVVITAGEQQPPDAAQCSLDPLPETLLDPLAGVAAVGRPVVLEITARDAAGQPVAGVPPGSFSVVATPSGTVTVQAPTNATDGAGHTLVVVTSTAAGPVAVQLLVNGQATPNPVNLTFVELVGVTAQYHLRTGLHLLTVPLAQPVVLTPEALANLELYQYDPTTAKYRAVNDWSLVQPGQGLFVRASGPTELALVGQAPAGSSPPPVIESWGAADLLPLLGMFRARETTEAGPSLRLFGGWNLAGHGLPEALDWRLEAFEVLVGGQPIGSLADPATWDYVAPYAFVFDGARYQLVFDDRLDGFEGVRTVVPALHGFWAYARPGVGQVEVRRVPAAGRRALGGAGWSLTLQATSGDATAEVRLGVHGGLSRDLPMAWPPAVNPNGLQFALTSGGRALAGEIVASLGASRSWQGEVTAPAGQDVVVSWPSLGRQVPSGYQAVLVDAQTQRAYPLATSAAWRFIAQGQPRRFTVTLARTSGARLRLQLGATPSRSRSAMLTLQLSQAATIEVRVTSLTGRLVRTISQTAASAGAMTVAWDGLDQAGRRVPAGTYQVVAIAETGGEVARAMTSVTIR